MIDSCVLGYESTHIYRGYGGFSYQDTWRLWAVGFWQIESHDPYKREKEKNVTNIF